MPKVTVIIPAYNYGCYLKQAIESVLQQRFDSYEIIVINDCSTDNTAEVLQEFANHPKIKIITHNENHGFIRSCHEAIEDSSGEYIIRLDADDYFDENALLVMSNILDANPEVGLVYSDYFTISAEGRIIDYVRLPRVNEEVKLLDIPANGAMMMFRRSCYEEVGGYDLSISCQDGYDLWLKFRHRFSFYNVNLPLFYYRRHGANYGEDSERLLSARRYIKQRQVADEGSPKPCVLGLIPVQAHNYCDYLALQKLAGKPLIAYTIEEALKTPELDQVVLTTEDEKIASAAQGYGVEVITHPPELVREAIEHTVLYVLAELEKQSFYPNVVIVLDVNSPFRKAEHITEAINTMMLFEVDSVTSVCQDMKIHYQHGPDGLTPLQENKILRQEKESLYEDNSAIYASRTEVITPQSFLGSRIGHIIMTRENSVNINSELDFLLAEQMVKK